SRIFLPSRSLHQPRTARPRPRSTKESAAARQGNPPAPMAGKYIVAGLVGSCVISYACDYIVSQKKIFGGTIPGTVSDKEWLKATEQRFQAWPRVAGPPVIMNPISRQNFIVKDLNP
uniref:Ozone-responsive stress related protein n=1 Tax=Aegilops tauschii subsp. strangulata TaxID=200361 RepID=A0A453QFM1_AEGTS